MNITSNSLLIFCLWSIVVAAAPINVLEKQIDLGKDPKTQKNLILKLYSFAEGTTAETDDTHWIAVIPSENELVFFSIQNGCPDYFPVTKIISTPPSFVVEIDPTAEYPFVDPQEAKAAGHKPSLGTMQVTISPDVQLFKEIVILIAKDNVKALANLVTKRTLSRVEDAIQKALGCKGEWFVQCDNQEKYESIMQTKRPITEPIVLTGKVNFIPKEAFLKMQDIFLEEALTELEEEQQNNSMQKA